MSEFLQVHALAHYPASNPNRDREGEPKRIIIGNVERGRISSQCLKRTWRTGEIFEREFGRPGEQQMSLRTKEIGGLIHKKLEQGGLSSADAEQWTLILGAVFGATKPEKKGTQDHFKNETLFLLSPEEKAALDGYAEKIIREKLTPPGIKGKEEMEKEAAKIRSQILSQESTAVDLAMFGRMFAQDKSFSVDAAVQVGHAFTVHGMDIEDDFFTAVDDVKERGDSDEDRGGGHLGSAGLGAGVFYLYASINMTALRERLKESKLVAKACQALVESMLTVFPKAKGNSCAQQGRAYFARVEKGDKAPRNLSLAFLDPVERKGDLGKAAAQRLTDMVGSIDKIYGPTYTSAKQFNVFTGEGSLKDLLELAGEPS